MRNLHKIVQDYTEDQLLCIWWMELYDYGSEFRINNKGEVEYHLILYDKWYAFKKNDIEYMRNSWISKGRPYIDVGTFKIKRKG